MANFIEYFKAGQRGESKGIPFGGGLESINSATNGIHKGRIYGVAGAEKSGKTTFADYGFVLYPYLYAIEHNIDIHWDYYSFEIDRVSKEFDFMVFFLNHDFNVETIRLPEGVTYCGESVVPLSSDYLRGYLVDDSQNIIKVPEDLFEAIKVVYETRIVPLFGEYNSNGIRIKEGMMNLVETRINPTGIYKDLLKSAEKVGTFIKDSSGYILSYTPNNPNRFNIVVIDHMRKLTIERGWTMKQTIDKMSEYMVVLRNILDTSFVPIIHTNRNLTSTERLKFFKTDIYPTSDDIKDSANLGEDCNYLFTTFNPNDDKYNLDSHFDLKIRDSRGNRLYPNMKTIHLVASRHGEFPRHFKVNMIGNLKKYEKL